MYINGTCMAVVHETTLGYHEFIPWDYGVGREGRGGVGSREGGVRVGREGRGGVGSREGGVRVGREGVRRGGE